VNNGADVINMSLGGGAYTSSCDTQPLASASNQAVDNGVVVFAASGNGYYDNALSSPACGSKVIAVGAVTESDGRVSFSNEGRELDIVAPGVSITSTIRGGAWATYQGTSMATPHAAGVAALVLQTNPSFSPTQVRNILQSTAVDLGTAGFDTIYGYGRVDAYAAYESALGSSANPSNQLPLAEAGGPYSGSEGALIGLSGSGSSDPDGIVASYAWSFGDGSAGTGVNPSHAYGDNGSYTVTLTVTDNNGAKANDTASVTVSNATPIVQAGADLNSYVNAVVSFTGSFTDAGTSDTHTAFWDFGDGSTSTSLVTSHAYTSVGTYTATLTVTDDDGAVGTDSRLITVSESPPPPQTTTVFSDDFQNGLTKWVESNEYDWNNERYAERNIPGYTSTNKVAHADACTTSTGCIITMKNSINLSTYSSATLTFWRYVDGSIDSGEFLKVEVFDGISWKRVFYWTNLSGDDDTWRQQTLDLSPYLASNFNLRFVGKMSSIYEEVEVDDVRIEGTY
jgi:PKD repeat protein